MLKFTNWSEDPYKHGESVLFANFLNADSLLDFAV